MNWDWKKFAEIAEAVAPIALGAAGVPPMLTGLVIHAVTIAQAAGQDTGTPKTGAEKKIIAMAIVSDGLNAVNAAKPGTLDIAQLTDVVSVGIDETVNAVKAAQNIPMKPAAPALTIARVPGTLPPAA